MRTGILAQKIGMTRIYDEKGAIVPVTVVQAGPCAVTQVKTVETDGYHAVQLGFGDIKARFAQVLHPISPAWPAMPLSICELTGCPPYWTDGQARSEVSGI
jgi:ribosomal protein L3